MTQIKEMLVAADGRKKNVDFQYYRGGELWYSTECGFKFPVPITDVGEATFLAQDKATLFMRYIRKHIDAISQDQTVHEPSAA